MLASKGWQLFVLLCVVPFVAMFAAMFSRSLVPSAVVAGSFTWLVLSWYWSIGSFLNSVLDVHLRLSSPRLTLATLYPVLYIPVFLWFFSEPGVPNPELIVPLHLMAMLCMFYVIYFVAKALTMVQRGRSVSFSDYVPTFLLLWLYPIGVWIVQPEINRVYQSSNQNAPNPQS